MAHTFTGSQHQLTLSGSLEEKVVLKLHSDKKKLNHQAEFLVRGKKLID